MNSKWKVCGCALLILLMICGFLFLSPRINEELTVFRRTQEFAAIETEFNAMVDELPRSLTDTLLVSRTIHPLSLGRGLFLGCIRGSRETLYGSTRGIENIQEEYRSFFENNPKWTENNNRTGYDTDVARFWLHEYKPSDFIYPAECNEFPLCYGARLDFADPSIASCSG